jgi:hypothetical protein
MRKGWTYARMARRYFAEFHGFDMEIWKRDRKLYGAVVVSTWIELKNEHFRTVRDAMEWAESMADAHQCFINRMKYQRENQK